MAKDCTAADLQSFLGSIFVHRTPSYSHLVWPEGIARADTAERSDSGENFARPSACADWPSVLEPGAELRRAACSGSLRRGQRRTDLVCGLWHWAGSRRRNARQGGGFPLSGVTFDPVSASVFTPVDTIDADLGVLPQRILPIASWTIGPRWSAIVKSSMRPWWQALTDGSSPWSLPSVLSPWSAIWL